MHAQGFFFQAFVYLAAAVNAVPIAKRLGLGSVLGYLNAGMIIGPGGYRLGDYARLGLPVTVLVVIMVTWLVPIFWSF